MSSSIVLHGSRHFVYQPNCNSFKKDEKQIEQIYNLFQSLQDGLESQTKNLDESYCGFLLSPRCEVFCYWHGPFNGSSMQWYKRPHRSYTASEYVWYNTTPQAHIGQLLNVVCSLEWIPKLRVCENMVSIPSLNLAVLWPTLTKHY